MTLQPQPFEVLATGLCHHAWLCLAFHNHSLQLLKELFQNSDVMALASNPSSGEAEAGGCVGVPGQPRFCGETSPSSYEFEHLCFWSDACLLCVSVSGVCGGWLLYLLFLFDPV